MKYWSLKTEGMPRASPVPHLLSQRRSRAHHLSRAPRIGQAQPPAEGLHDDVAHLRPELEMRVSQDFAVEQDTGEPTPVPMVMVTAQSKSRARP